LRQKAFFCRSRALLAQVFSFLGKNFFEKKSPSFPQNASLKMLVLDFTKLLPGPLATRQLAEMGFRVVKIEHPDSPDPARFYPPMIDGQGAVFVALNADKELLSIDYRSLQGREAILDWVRRADVLVESFRPGAMAAWGLDYESLSAVNPGLVYASVTGYGQTGPRAKLAGHDLNYIALSGLLALNFDAQGDPVIPDMQIADVAGGSQQAVNAVLHALLERGRTGRGRYLDISMLDGVRPLLTVARAFIAAGEAFEPGRPSILSGRWANYNVYRCADGRHLALGALEPKFWNAFCLWAGRPDWAERFTVDDAGQAELRRELADFFLQKNMAEWTALSEGTDFCLTPVLYPDEAD
jgi:crotonobetainyl-CoA:carnitine CoA-transferase CaiB-like acyl-CoA transferase